MITRHNKYKEMFVYFLDQVCNIVIVVSVFSCLVTIVSAITEAFSKV